MAVIVPYSGVVITGLERVAVIPTLLGWDGDLVVPFPSIGFGCTDLTARLLGAASDLLAEEPRTLLCSVNCGSPSVGE